MTIKEDFQKAIDTLNASSNILITSHARPDGDACGAIAAFTEALTAQGKAVNPLLLSDVPDWYKFLFDQLPPVLGKDFSEEKLKQLQPDLIIIVDTNSNSQLSGFADYLKANQKPVLVIDHHITSDNLGDVELIDATASATGLIVYELFKAAGWQITPTIAQAIFTAIATDTGWFHFANTDTRTLRTAAELTEAGAGPTKLYKQLYQNFSPQRFKLMTKMLDSLQLHFDDRYAALHINDADFEQTGATHADTENLIDFSQLISTIQVAVLFVELPDGKIKISLRSTSGVDVRLIAQKFGGGGHKMAAGAKLDQPIKTAQKIILDEISSQLK
jgi:phosphoesterase RecJ-like protein